MKYFYRRSSVIVCAFCALLLAACSESVTPAPQSDAVSAALPTVDANAAPPPTFVSGDPINGTPTPTPKFSPTPRPTSTPRYTPTPVPTATPAPPAKLQQIAVCSANAVPGGTRSLCDYSSHVWRMNGVQFFLPQFGINSTTFYNDNYTSSIADIDRWLDLINSQLHANVVRIQVEMEHRDGSATQTPTRLSTIDDFITRATKRGFRVGISLHNDGFFDLSPIKTQWVQNFIAHYKNERPDLQTMIAYVSFENEINVHRNEYCAPPDPASSIDCFQNNPGYVAQANNWVIGMQKLFKTLPSPDNHSPILTTVGISTELRRTDGRHPAVNYFIDFTANPGDRKKIVGAQTIAANVDFLSPHNYGGGGAGTFFTISDDWGYTGPTVLEEYGFPTDPYSDSPTAPRYPVSKAFREGDPVKDIFGQPGATPSAIYYVSANIQSMESWGAQGKVAGGVGAILADSYDRSCNNPHQDDYTGIFATHGQYCGGTKTTGDGQLKLTGKLMAAHNLYWSGNIATLSPPTLAP